MTDLPAPVQVPLMLLSRLRGAFDTAVASLAERCAAGGTQVDAALFDKYQVEAYELAWTCADLLAAETYLREVAPQAAAVEAALAAVFAVDAISASLPRLETVYLALGLDLGALRAMSAAPEWAALRQASGTGEALAAAGARLVRHANEGGQTWAVVPLDEPLQMARASFHRFAMDVVAPQAAAIHRHNLTVPEPLIDGLRQMGVFGLSIPERLGGIAPDDRDDTQMMVVVTEALSEGSLGAAGSLITRPEILSRALLVGGTLAQQQHWLPKIAAGQPLCAIAITEPDAGSDVASLQLKASPVPGGWRLDGAKTWCTFAGKAGLLMVLARTDADRNLGYKGLSLLLVEKPPTEAHAFDHQQSDGGRLRGRAIPTIGYRGMHSYEVSFEAWFVPDDHVIGEATGLGKGFYFTMAGMMGGRLQTAARACGVMWAALRAALAYSADRQVFGAPLNKYPLTLAKLARMAARLAACRHLTYAIARVMDSGGGRVEASLVKLLACRSAEWLTREALQLHGGMGYAEETDVSRYFVDARVLSIFEGAEETLALKVIARGLVEAALSHP